MIYDTIPVIKTIQCSENQTLFLEFMDGKSWIINCSPVNSESVYTRFYNEDYFRKARLNKVKNIIQRDEDLDMDGYGLYLEIIQNNGSNK